METAPFLLAAGALGRLYLEIIYLTVFGIGFVGLAFSLVFGDHDHEADHDHDHDHDTEGHGNMSLLSLKVVWCLFVGAGIGGYFGAYNGLGNAGAFGCATLIGLIMAGIGYTVMNSFYKGQGSSTVRTASLIGLVGTVETTVPASGSGRVQLSVNGQSVLYLAESAHGAELKEGAVVRISEIAGTTALVEPVTR